MHTTNYTNTFIEVADDCPVGAAEVPPGRKEKTIASYQYEMLADHPYKLSSDEVVFRSYALKHRIAVNDQEMQKFFSKGQPCMRASPLAKRYGWGVHSDDQGRIAIYALETKRYRELREDPKLVHLKAMRSAKA